MNRNPRSRRDVVASHGEAQRYFRDVVLNYDGDECLLWPLARFTDGYGSVRHEGRVQQVHRAVCKIFNGPPPTPTHHAAHSCGRGNEGCCTWRHLSWKTPKENSADTIAQGKTRRGHRLAPKFRFYGQLTPTDVAKIRALNGFLTYEQIGAAFKIGHTTVGRIINRDRGWRFEVANLSGPLTPELAGPDDGRPNPGAANLSEVA